MLKLIRYVNERGGHAIVPELKKPPKVFDCLSHIFQNLLDHEIMVTKKMMDSYNTIIFPNGFSGNISYISFLSS